MAHHNKNVSLAVSPIRDQRYIRKIVAMLRPNPRNHLMFVLGVNNGIRLRDMLRLTCGTLRDNQNPGDYFRIFERKTKKHNIMVVNEPVAKAIKMYFAAYPNRDNHDPVFFSEKTGKALTVEYSADMVQRWCIAAGCPKTERYGAHTLRKTWAYIQRTVHGTPWEAICDRLNHASPQETMRYLGMDIQERVAVCMAPVS